MDIKKYEVPFTILIAVVAFLEILFLIKVLFADTAGFEWGNVADWVSASCNIAMASAAVYAAFQAKKWLKPKLNQNGLPDTIEFLKKNVKTLLNGIVIDTIDEHFIDLIRELEDAIENNREAALSTYNNLEREYSNIKYMQNPYPQDYKYTFHSKKSELMWYGYSLKENKERIIEEIFKLRNEYFDISSLKRGSAHNLFLAGLSELVQSSSVIKKSKSLRIINTTIKKLEELSNKQKQLHIRLMQLHKELMGDNPAITDFFEIK